MKKRRGLRKYYRRLARLNEFSAGESWLSYIHDADDWFNYAHLHFDWKGYGDLRWKERAAHLDALFRHYEMLAGACHHVERPLQVFALIHEFDSGSDALYLHSPNPMGDNYPFRSEYVEVCTFTSRNLVDYLECLVARGYTVLYAPPGSRYSDCVVFRDTVCDNHLIKK